jgi:hypothetical protein
MNMNEIPEILPRNLPKYKWDLEGLHDNICRFSQRVEELGNVYEAVLLDPIENIRTKEEYLIVRLTTYRLIFKLNRFILRRIDNPEKRYAMKHDIVMNLFAIMYYINSMMIKAQKKAQEGVRRRRRRM